MSVLRRVVSVFIAARVATIVVVLIIRQIRPDLGVTEVLTDWDGNWNEFVAQDGYHQLMVDGGLVKHEWQLLAFFPVLPFTVRALHAVSGIGVHVLGPVVAIACALAGFVVLARLMARTVGEETAIAACALMLFSPNAYVLSMFYTEGPVILFTALTFEALAPREGGPRWVLAGVAALLAGLSRPNGFVLVVPVLIVAIRHLRRERDWRALIAVVLAPAGFVGWIVLAWVRTGSITGYFDIQSLGWGASVDWGRSTLRGLWHLADSGATLDQRMNVVAVVFGVVGLVVIWRQRLDAAWIGYAAALVVLTTINERQASGFRFLLPAFPLFVGYANAIPKRHQPMLLASSAMVMGALFMVSATYGVYTP